MAARWLEFVWIAACAVASCKTETAPPIARVPTVRLVPRPAETASSKPTILATDRQSGVVEGRTLARAANTSIVVAGLRFDIGAPVVLWTDPGGYDAYREHGFFDDDGQPAKKRYRPGRAPWTDPVSRENEPAPGEARPTLERLRELVDQFVLHYDTCGTSRRCFEILHDKRRLSVHFLLDLDGTLYQTLDLAETAWHARQANPRSIGVEIANLGAYPAGESDVLDRGYVERGDDVRVALDANSALRTARFIARPIRPERVRGAANGLDLEMHDLTREQYATLTRLAAGLARVFPKLALDAPRDAAGVVRTDALSDEEFANYSGLIGHQHVSADKQDPGPALDWERLLARARGLRALER